VTLDQVRFKRAELKIKLICAQEEPVITIYKLSPLGEKDKTYALICIKLIAWNKSDEN
jgi:hypothetical protein